MSAHDEIAAIYARNVARIEKSTIAELVRELTKANEDLARMTELAYHTAPGEMEFAPEGWTWRQQAQRDYQRLIEAERRINELEGIIGNASL